MEEKIVLSLFIFAIVGTLLLITYQTKSKLFGSLLVATILISAATYLFRFSDLNQFTLKSFSNEAKFVRTKKQEVGENAALVQRLKNESVKQAAEIKKAKDQITEVEKQANEALPENHPVTEPTASLHLIIKGRPPFHG